LAVALAILGLWFSLPVKQAQAVPSFARQMGLDCNACHTMFPELTPVGRNFKLNGFTATKHGDKPYEWPPPISGMVQLSFTHLQNDRPAGTFDPSNRANDNVNVPQAISLFYGGRIYGEHLGGLIQGIMTGILGTLYHTQSAAPLLTTLFISWSGRRFEVQRDVAGVYPRGAAADEMKELASL